MNLLNNLFNIDDIEINKLNKRYMYFFLVIVLIIIVLLIIKKDYYYANSFSLLNNEINLFVEKEYIDIIQKKNVIFINDISNNYSINTIMPLNDNYIVSVNLKTPISNISDGNYKIYLGKERLFDYIVRIIKK